MAQYFTDFSEPDAISQWTSRWNSVGLEVKVENGEHYLEVTASSNFLRRFISWDVVPPSRHVKVLARMSGGNDRRLATRGAGGVGSETAWTFGRRTSTGARIATYSNGTYTNRQEATVFAYNEADVVFNEAYSEGSKQQWREWLEGGDKPEWLIDVSSSAVSDAGLVGLFCFETPISIKVWSFAVGTDGDDAPIGPVDDDKFLYDPRLFAVAGAGGAPTLSAPGVIDITATSARPQVTLTY